MRKYLFLAIVAMMLMMPLSAWSGVGEEFTANSKNGVEMKFKILSEEKKTCTVYGFDYNDPSIDINTEGAVEIPSVANGYTVVGIAKYAFYRCTKITAITIPETVTSIETMSFTDNDALQSITVDKNNPVLDSRGNCNAVIKTETNSLILGCKGTVIPNTVTSLAFYSFLDCRKMTSIKIPASVKQIDSNAFRGCSGLNTITVEEGNTVYDSRNNCNAVIETASNRLIVGTNNTVIPETVTAIGEIAFYQKYDLKTITIPPSVRSIGYHSFAYSGLTSIDIPAIIIGEQAFESTPLAEVKLGNNLRTIGNKAFHFCSSLKSIELPASVASIGDGAFSLTPLTKVISHIDQPFDIGNDAFRYDYSGGVTLYVPAGTKPLYEETAGWKKFPTIIEDEEIKGTIIGDLNGDGKVNATDVVELVKIVMSTK